MLKPILKIHNELQKEGWLKRKEMEYENMVPILILFIFKNIIHIVKKVPKGFFLIFFKGKYVRVWYIFTYTNPVLWNTYNTNAKIPKRRKRKMLWNEGVARRMLKVFLFLLLLFIIYYYDYILIFLVYILWIMLKDV